MTKKRITVQKLREQLKECPNYAKVRVSGKDHPPRLTVDGKTRSWHINLKESD